MAKTAKSVAYLELNISGFDTALKTATNLMKTFVAGWSAYKLGKFFSDGVSDAITFGKEMQSISRTMGGFDPGALLLVQKSLERAGMSAGEAQGHIGDFIREGRNISEMFGGTENYAKALQSASKDYGAQAGVLHRSAQFLQTVWNTMESIGSKLRTFFLTMAEQFVGPLQVALDYLNQIDLAGVGASFGKAIADAAETLFGLFRNGDIYKILEIGLKIAFFESVEFLKKSFSNIYDVAIPKIAEALKNGFISAVEVLAEALEKLRYSDVGKALFGSKEIKSPEDLGAVGAAKFGLIDTPLAAIEKYFISFAKITENTPNAEKWKKKQNQSFGDFLNDKFETSNDSKNPIGTGIEAIKEWMKGVNIPKTSTSSYSESPDDKAFRDELKKSFAETISKGFKTGTDMANNAKIDNSNASPKGLLNTFSGSSSHVIADSLAKVGGGGGYLRAGMSLAEKSAMQTAMATKQTAETLKAMHAESKKNPAAPTPLGR